MGPDPAVFLFANPDPEADPALPNCSVPVSSVAEPEPAGAVTFWSEPV